MAKRREVKGALGRLSVFGGRPVNRDALRLMHRYADAGGKLRPLPRAEDVKSPKVVIDGWLDLTPEEKAVQLRRLNKLK